METHKGIPVSPGVAIGPVVTLDTEDLVVAKRHVPDDLVDGELARLREALDASIGQLDQLRQVAADRVGAELSSVFDFHRGVLTDLSVVRRLQEAIRQERLTAESAASMVFQDYAGELSRLNDPYLSERARDINDVEHRVIRALVGKRREGLHSLDHDVILAAHDMLPSQTVSLDRQHVRAFITRVGGRTSHTAILARAMGVPAVVGLGEMIATLSADQTLIVDGGSGIVIVDPEPEQIEEYRKIQSRWIRRVADLDRLRDLPAETQDGCRVSLLANIEFPDEIQPAIGHGAEGVGLYRTEFLFVNRQGVVSEQDHYIAYRRAIERLGNRPLVIRTLDLGADKFMVDGKPSDERNPFLGDRSIRLCLRNIPVFRAQLRAILRAAVSGDVRMMLPMVSTLWELRQARMLLADVADELDEEGIPFKADMPVGVMIEVPSAALMADQFAREAAFFSIGTNDLIQYTLAVDRTNERVAGLYTPCHPAVLRLVRDVIRSAGRNGIPVSLCGEMAGEPVYTLLLLGLGLRTFSMNGADVAEVKKLIRSTTLEHARSVARQAMALDSERQIQRLLEEETRRLVPELFTS